MKPLAKVVELIIEKAFIKGKGPAFAKIFCNWRIIVGNNLAQICVPILIDKTDKTLVIDVYERSKSLEIHFMKEVIIQKINIILAEKNLSPKIKKIYIRNRQI